MPVFSDSTLPGENDAEFRTDVAVGDPKSFMEDFYQSQEFADSFKSFLQGKRLDPEIPEEERIKAFLTQDLAKFALLDYDRDRKRLKYDRSFYSEKAIGDIQNYIDFAREIKEMERGGEITQENIAGLDEMRRAYHTRAAQALVGDGLAPTVKMGRALLTLILIDKGLETFASSRRADIAAISRKIGV